MKQSAHNPAWRAGSVAIFAACVLASQSGCGGGSGAKSAVSRTASRALTITFRWPTTANEPTRALPATTQSVVVSVQDAQGFQDQQVVNRPENLGDTFGTVQFFALSDGAAQVQARAYSAPAAGGQVLAEAGQNLSLSRNETEAVTLTFNAAYTAIVVQTETPGAPVNVLQGETVRLVARGTLADGTVVETAPAGSFNTSNSSVATVNATTGVVTTTGPGVVTITFVDGFGRAGFANLTVRGGDAEVSIQ